MGILSILSLLGSASILIVGLYLSILEPPPVEAQKSLSMFFDHIGLFLVFGGTLAATSLSFRIDKMYTFVVIFLKRIIRDEKTDFAAIIKELMKLSEANRAASPQLEGMIDKLEDRFLKDAMQTFLDQVLDKKNLIRVLKSRSANIYQHFLSDANKFKTMSRFPPAFGLMGTTIGMIVLLKGLGGPEGAAGIGPAMSICLTATLYGVATANLLLIPISEHLQTAAKEEFFKNNIITEGVKLIYEKTNPVELAEILNAYLRPADRVDWKKVVKKGV